MKYTLEFSENFKEDSKKIKRSGNKALFDKLEKLLEELTENPKTGTGKPEQLKHFETPTWSRRISAKYRLFTKFTKIQWWFCYFRHTDIILTNKIL